MNLPNILTLLRIALIPFFAVSFLFEGVSDWVTLAIFAVASLTDWLDGFIARKQNIVTNFGKLMDPLADKIMVMAAFVCFSAEGLVHPAVTILVLARDLLVTGLRMLATAEGKVIAADLWGKLKTVFQYIVIILVLVQSTFGAGGVGIISVAVHFAVWVMVLLTVVSAANYCWQNKDLLKKKP